MNILWFTWKDRANPLAGGAEVVNEQLARRLVDDGHEVTLVVGGFAGAEAEDTTHGYRIIRLGSRWTVYYQAWRYYRRHLRGWADLVIDEVNTIPFLAKYYVREPNVVFAHMLCREIWFYELPRPLGFIGYVLEPLYLRLLGDRTTITVSNSTKRDLMRYGFESKRIHLISEGLETPPLPRLPGDKFAEPTLLSLGAMRAMKRTLDQIKAFELACDSWPELRLVIAGDNTGTYGAKVMQAIASSRHHEAIDYRGRVSQAEKAELMRRCHAVMVTSVKEGWGLVVTEAAAQGTPAIVYDVDGLRDSVRDGISGLVTSTNTPAALAATIGQLLANPTQYNDLRRNAWQWSKTITFDRSYTDFKEVIGL